MPLLDGKIFGPFQPEPDASLWCVPQLLLTNREGDEAWHHRPDLESHVADIDIGNPTIPLTKTVSSIVPGSAKMTSSRTSSELRLLSHLSSGRLWDSFRAIRKTCFPQTESEPEPEPVVVKSTCPVTFPSHHPFSGHLTETEARAGIFREDGIYRSILPPSWLVNVVPRYFGLWGGLLPVKSRWGRAMMRREVWVMVLEDCGVAVEVDGLGLSEK